MLHGTLPESALDTYQQERRPHATQLILQAVAVGIVMTAGGRMGDALRRLIAPRLQVIPGIRARVLDSVTPRLGPSRFVVRRRWGRGPAGTLCPNAPVDGGPGWANRSTLGLPECTTWLRWSGLMEP